jgi:CBS domain-containing protein
LMTLHRIKEVPRVAWPTTRASQVMVPFADLKRIDPDTGLWSALQQLDRDGVNQLPVVSGGRVIGMLTREDVISFLRTVQDLGS